MRIFLICLLTLSLLYQDAFSQSTYFKYFFYGSSNGRHYALGKCASLINDDLALIYYVSGHGAGGDDIHRYSETLKLKRVITPRDTHKFTYRTNPEVVRFDRVDQGFIYSHVVNDNGSYRRVTVKCDENGTQKWLKAQMKLTTICDIPTIGTTGINFNHFIRLDTNGNTKFDTSVAQIVSGRKLHSYKTIFTGIIKDTSILVLTNEKDSFEVIKLDLNGNRISNQVYSGVNLVDIKYRNGQIISIEKDSSFEIKINDLNINTTHRYSLSNQFPLTYDQFLVKDSLITLVLYNNVDGFKYGTKNIPELLVLNTKGQFVKRRYLRYHYGKDHSKPKNITGPIIEGIDYTSEFGYFISVNLETDLYGGYFGVIKLNSDLVANDSIFVSPNKMYLNRPDSCLLEKTKPKSIEESQPNFDLIVYPIPAKEWLHIDAGDEIFTEFEIYNLTGAIQTQGKVEENSIGVSNLKGGSYILQIRNTNEIFRQKIFIE